MKVGEHVEILHAEDARAPAFLVLGAGDDILIPGLPYAASPPPTERANIPRVGD